MYGFRDSYALFGSVLIIRTVPSVWVTDMALLTLTEGELASQWNQSRATR